jgi:hypothetical protein
MKARPMGTDQGMIGRGCCMQRRAKMCAWCQAESVCRKDCSVQPGHRFCCVAAPCEAAPGRGLAQAQGPSHQQDVGPMPSVRRRHRPLLARREPCQAFVGHKPPDPLQRLLRLLVRRRLRARNGRRPRLRVDWLQQGYRDQHRRRDDRGSRPHVRGGRAVRAAAASCGVHCQWPRNAGTADRGHLINETYAAQPTPVVERAVPSGGRRFQTGSSDQIRARVQPPILCTY